MATWKEQFLAGLAKIRDTCPRCLLIGRIPNFGSVPDPGLSRLSPIPLHLFLPLSLSLSAAAPSSALFRPRWPPFALFHPATHFFPNGDGIGPRRNARVTCAPGRNEFLIKPYEFNGTKATAGRVSVDVETLAESRKPALFNNSSPGRANFKRRCHAAPSACLTDIR